MMLGQFYELPKACSSCVLKDVKVLSKSVIPKQAILADLLFYFNPKRYNISVSPRETKEVCMLALKQGRFCLVPRGAI